MASSLRILLSLVSFSILIAAVSSSGRSFPFYLHHHHHHHLPSIPLTAVADIHDLLPLYGLPKGIIPDGVKSYTLSPDGYFSVELETHCYVHFDDLVYYDTHIKGRLTKGKISGVSGIQAKLAFLWLPVTGLEADSKSDTVEFYVGALSKKLPAKQFETVPACKTKALGESLFVRSV